MNRKYIHRAKEYDIKDRLEHKGIYCISKKWINWAKRYLNRVERRKTRQKTKRGDLDERSSNDI